MLQFPHYTATKHLKKRAHSPPDLTQKGIFSPERIAQMEASAGPLKLLYAGERVDPMILSDLFALAEEAHVYDKMAAMQRGKVLNQIVGHPSEERQVLHTAMRDFFDPQQQAPEASTRAHQELEKLQHFLTTIDSKKYTDIVQIGIGGSELGPKAIAIALEAFRKQGRRAHFISNIDPDDLTYVFASLDLAKTLVVVVSKSGTTLETLTNEALARQRYVEKGLDPKNHFLAVTGEGSPMDDPHRYRTSFFIWDYIGGRYSVTSMVGCVVLGFLLGMEHLLSFLRGASDMDKIALQRHPQKNLPLLSAVLGIWNHNFLHHPTTAIIPYSRALGRFPAHLQQCDMESNGKRIDRQGNVVDFWTGPVIWGEPGTNGQHSFYQLIHQGTQPVPLELIGFAHSQYHHDLVVQETTSQQKLLANLFAQSIALATGQTSENPNQTFPGNRPHRILFAEQCNPHTVGALLAYYEHKIVFQGWIWDINSFDQEGVQLGKVLAQKILTEFSDHQEDGRGFPLGRAYLNTLAEYPSDTSP